VTLGLGRKLDEDDISERLGRIHRRFQQIADMEAKAASQRPGEAVPSPFTKEKLKLIERTEELLKEWERIPDA
jgi:hypothetical protein